ncbi:CDF family Co(II)/Ni(II) efflux transporter DmeF [Ramlibacter sp. MAHUQ-53]|uniref:CDF family Co(II)/Ni(II) efflux transporter DmeF n=1 Tax=unclassified Ramlibacter TaxID=2617605 RepID=UPI00363FEDE3
MSLPRDPSPWDHHHDWSADSAAAERGTRLVAWITAAAMVLEIGAGWWFNSMALLADGWHMGSHVVAIGLSAVAYASARRYATDPRFAFGTWKVEVLAGFASAVFLVVMAGLMAVGSVERLFSPQPIDYRDALAVAVLGLGVNLVCARILGHAHGHGHGHAHGEHDPGHGHAGGHHDLNLKSAYLHVLADAATSALAIGALLGGWFLGWSWLDPVMGLVGAVVVAVWARGLLAETGRALLDREMDHPVVEEIREAVEGDDPATRITDLHVWRIGRHAYACALTVVSTDRALTAATVRERLSVHDEVVHSTIEVHHDVAGGPG